MLKVLVICDDYWHPGEVIVRGLRKIEKDFDLDFVMEAKNILTNDMLRCYDVIINAKGGRSTGTYCPPWFEENVVQVTPADFKAYIEEGHGFIALHSGTTFKKDTMPEMVDITGCSFLYHPVQCDVTFEAVGEHPILGGFEPFTVRDEHYCLDIHADDADVFLRGTSDSSAGTQVAGYTRLIGEGRFCALTPGHYCAVFENDGFARVLSNAIRWCAKDI